MPASDSSLAQDEALAPTQRALSSDGYLTTAVLAQVGRPPGHWPPVGPSRGHTRRRGNAAAGAGCEEGSGFERPRARARLGIAKTSAPAAPIQIRLRPRRGNLGLWGEPFVQSSRTGERTDEPGGCSIRRDRPPVRSHRSKDLAPARRGRRRHQRAPPSRRHDDRRQRLRLGRRCSSPLTRIAALPHPFSCISRLTLGCCYSKLSSAAGLAGRPPEPRGAAGG